MPIRTLVPCVRTCRRVAAASQSGPAAQAFSQLRAAGMPSAADFPVVILTHGGTPAVDQATAIALDTPGVWTVLAPATPAFRSRARKILKDL